MKHIKLIPQPLTSEAFSQYGDVIEVNNKAEIRTINHGYTTRYHDLAHLDLLNQKGKPTLNIFRSTPLPRPIEIQIMERHPLSSQAFMPLSERPYLIVVAKEGEFDHNKMVCFLAQSNQGVNYHAGIWHHFNLALDEISDFLVIDRDGPEKNCDEITLEESIYIDY
jgi:ureidoglycolate lyase